MSCTLAIFVALSLTAADAGSTGGNTRGGNNATKEGISPALGAWDSGPASDEKFFGKNGDYPTDHRPAVDVFHFKHPYPVVQDSDEFDRDYVKDENSDNGNWKAQTEYDRLRHKLLKEKEDVQKALEAKKKAEDELQDAMRREKDAEGRKKSEEEKSKKTGGKGDGTKVNKPKTPGATASAGKVKIAADEVEKAMKHLEDCKKELAEAREKLKKLLDELEEAKKKQQETEDALEKAKAKVDPLEEKYKDATKSADEEYKEYLEAKAAYEKQLAKLAQMEKDIAAAAEKVKKIRDSEDADGGVYPTHSKSVATSGSVALVFLLTAFSVRQ